MKEKITKLYKYFKTKTKRQKNFKNYKKQDDRIKKISIIIEEKIIKEIKKVKTTDEVKKLLKIKENIIDVYEYIIGIDKEYSKELLKKVNKYYVRTKSKHCTITKKSFLKKNW